ncbi:sugar transferase [Polaribacter marinivivus]|uniref:Sugar transferase n=1 Tax=Polaribacter marinivivus TaxID=1524260 RepID=A0ABV8RBN2_9FLAO
MNAITNEITRAEKKNIFHIRKNHIFGSNRISEDLTNKLHNYIVDETNINLNHLLVSNIVTNLEYTYKSYHKGILNLHKINDIRFINKFFERINEVIDIDDTFVCCVETFTSRRERKRINKIPFLRDFYFSIEFVFMRIFPKVKFLRKIYFTLTGGKNRLLSKAEALGRLVCCGFEIIDYKNIDGLIYIVTKKQNNPTYDMNPSYGPIYKMPRIGKSKKIINVYKLRTMHPYSEYLQKYVFEKNGTANGDKVNDDFRISPLGRFFRKVWIDELPMLINLLKGDLKIVGVRPLSKAKFNMYPSEVQNLRTKTKPGLVPPFYADLPNNFEELVESEVNYLNQYLKNPLSTDIRYFYKAFVNIFFKGARSK